MFMSESKKTDTSSRSSAKQEPSAGSNNGNVPSDSAVFLADEDAKELKAKPGIRLSPFAIMLISVLFLVILALFVYRQMDAVISKQHSLEIAILNNKNELSNEFNKSVNELHKEQRDLGAQYNELKQAIDEIKKIAGRERQGWVLAEAEYLLLIANHKLKLEGDVKTAMQAMLDADSRIERLGDPQLLAARKKIAQELAGLQTIKQADINGMSLTLSTLSERVSELSLSTAQPGKLREKKRKQIAEEKSLEQSSTNKKWQSVFKEFWLELKSTLVIHRRDKPIAPMLAPEQVKALRQVLQFRLESARVSLLRRDQQQFTHSITLALAWLEQHFDTGDEAVVKFRQTLAQLKTETLTTELPDISGSLQEVRYQLNKNSTAIVQPEKKQKENKETVAPDSNKKSSDDKPTESSSPL